MAAVLVVLADSTIRVGLCRGLEACGQETIGLSVWNEVSALTANGSLAAVVFNPEPSEALDWKHSLETLRHFQTDLIGIALIESPWIGGLTWPAGVSVVRWSKSSAVAARVADLIARQTAARDSKRLLDGLHARVLADDEEARDQFCAYILAEVRRQLLVTLGGEDHDLIDMAIDDVLVKYCCRPTLYEPARGHPVALLRKMAADRFVDLIRLRRRRTTHEVAAGIVFDTTPAVPAMDTQSCDGVTDRAAQRRFLLSVGGNDQERAFIDVWLGDPRRAILAQALGIGDLPEAAQRVAIHRMTDRLRQRARRALAHGHRPK